MGDHLHVCTRETPVIKEFDDEEKEFFKSLV